MTEKKHKEEAPKKIDERLDDLQPEQDPKGGQGSSETPLRTSLRDEPRGGWDGNHNITAMAPRRRRKARR
jgi:hypothetical protein